MVIMLLLLGGILSIVIYLKIKNILSTRQAVKRVAVSKYAEKKAEKLLKRNGFQIVDRQQSRPLVIRTGNTFHRYWIRIDFLVKKNGRTYVVEVKSGHKNKITKRETRRQLLEYFLAYKPHGIILFDMETKKFSEIKFLLPYFNSRFAENAIFFLLGILITILGMYVFYNQKL